MPEKLSPYFFYDVAISICSDRNDLAHGHFAICHNPAIAAIIPG